MADAADSRQTGWDFVPKKGPLDPIKMRKETRDWLAAHTLEDVKGIAHDLENAGEDVSELVDAINELEALVKPGPGHSRPAAEKAEA
jgi:hypothetical protein